MPKSPWETAATGSEHSHQVALFQWAAMAAFAGVGLADDELSYTVKGYAAAKKAAKDLQPEPRLARLHAIKNQGHGDHIRGNQSRAEGVRAGVPDIFLPVPVLASQLDKGVWQDYVRPFPNDGYGFGVVCGLYIELKKPKTDGKAEGKLSAEQVEWIDYLRTNGYAVVVAIGWLEAREWLLRYLE